MGHTWGTVVGGFVKMLGYRPYTQIATIHKHSQELDVWGKPKTSISTTLNCYTREVTSLEATGLIGKHGKELLKSIVIGFPGNPPVFVGDTIEIEKRPLQIYKISTIKDLSGEVISTLAYGSCA